MEPDRVTDPQERASTRVSRGVVVGGLVGFLLGAALGALIGAWAFDRGAAIAGATIAGAIGLGLIGGFVGGMANLESPNPGAEPSERRHPLEDPELTSEEDLPSVRDVRGDDVPPRAVP